MALVQNMLSRAGNKVANQFEINLAAGKLFQSYNSLIACKVYGCKTIYISEKWEHSKTTMQYFKEFVGTDCSAKEIRKLIEEGFYIVVSEGDLEQLAQTGELLDETL